MLLVYALIVAVIIGYLTGGRLRNYVDHPLKMVMLPCLAFMTEACFGPIYENVSLPPSVWLGWLVCLEYLLLALFIYFNRTRRGVRLLGIATLTNFIVIAANDFRMPVSPIVHNNRALAGLIARIQCGELMEYVLVDWDGPLWYLGDTIPMFGGLASIGDILMAAALVVLIVDVMKKEQPKKRAPKT